jgi:hypothetical protein
MTKLEQIQSSIEKLSAEEIAALREWLDELDERLFDEKLERDAITSAARAESCQHYASPGFWLAMRHCQAALRR